MQVYLVGGAVRDEILGRAVKDSDWVVVGSTQEEMLEKGFQQVGKSFPVFLHPDSKEEYALARIEQKSGHGYREFTFDTSKSVTLEDDLKRRDLTINAIAKDGASGEYIDPFNGIGDINNKMLRHVSDAFVEDPLRVLRVARFKAQLHDFGFSIADETLVLMKALSCSGELEYLSPERIWQEFSRALASPSPGVFIECLYECGALKVIFPELHALWGVPQNPEHHPEVDTGIHTLLCLQKASDISDDIRVRFASLCHDLGKGVTPKEILPSHKGHEEAGVAIIKNWCDDNAVPVDIKDAAILAARYHGWCHRALELNEHELLKLLNATDVLRRPERLEVLIMASKADSLGRDGFAESDYPQADFLRKSAEAVISVKIDSVDTRNISGAMIGEKLSELRIEALKKVKEEFSKK